MALNPLGAIRREGRKLKWRCLRATSDGIRGLEDLLLTRVFEEELWAVAQHVQPDIIHAHSPYQCGVPAYRVARRMGIPMVYEVRGLWEESGVANGLFRLGGAKYQFWKRMDSEAMLGADVVVCICEQLRTEVIRRGVAAERVFVVPNAVDTSVFHPIARHEEGNPDSVPQEVKSLRARLRGRTVGYIGSIRKLEGIDELVRAAGEMLRRGQDFSLVIIGDGPDTDELKTLAAEEGLGDRAVFEIGRASCRERV
jgi:glycosyltransferase involved in cell wall biosynthesis